MGVRNLSTYIHHFQHVVNDHLQHHACQLIESYHDDLEFYLSYFIKFEQAMKEKQQFFKCPLSKRNLVSFMENDILFDIDNCDGLMHPTSIYLEYATDESDAKDFQMEKHVDAINKMMDNLLMATDFLEILCA